MGFSHSKVRTHEERGAIVDVDLDKLEQFHDSMRVRQAKYNSDTRARQLLKEEIGAHLRDDAPAIPLPHQVNAYCLMKGLVDDNQRGGVYADEAGLGKTFTCLIFGRMLCPADRTMVVLAPKLLVESVWQLEIAKWLKDQRHEVINTANEVSDVVRRKDSLGGYFIIVNEQDMVLHEGVWSQLAKLQPAFLFIDEGSMLGNARNKAVCLVETIKARDTIPWIVSATPFRDGHSGRTADAERKFLESMVQYDAITQKRAAYQTLNRRTEAAAAKMGDSMELAMANMGFVIRHSADEIRDLLPRLQFTKRPARAPKASTHRRVAAMLAVQQRHALLDDRAASQTWLSRVFELTTFEPRKVEVLAQETAMHQMRKDTSDAYADDFERMLTTGQAQMGECQSCNMSSCAPLWLPCCKQNSPTCTMCVIESLYDDHGQVLASFTCPSCGETLPSKQLQDANRAGSWVDFNITHEYRLEKTTRGKTLLALLRILRPGQKVLLAGVKATEERSQICSMLTRNRIPHCCPGESQRSADTLSDLREFAQVPNIRVLIMPKNLKQGVDHLKVAQKIVFWDTEHLDYRNLVNRHSIIKRVCRLGCGHKSVDVVTLHQSFLETSEAGADRPAVRSVRLCPLEDMSDDSDGPSCSVPGNPPVNVDALHVQGDGEAFHPCANPVPRSPEPCNQGSLEVGQSVQISAMQTAKQLNGQTGELLSFDSSKCRWTVALSNTTKQVAVQPGNLQVIDKHDSAEHLARDAEVNGAGAFRVGQRVQVVNMETATNLNGKEGSLQDFDSVTGRWTVRLVENAKLIAARTRNLKLMANREARANQRKRPAEIPTESLHDSPERV